MLRAAVWNSFRLYRSVPRFFSVPSCTLTTEKTVTGITVEDVENDGGITKGVLSMVNSQISEKNHGRLFAIIHIAGKKFKVTEEDVLALAVHFPANVGDKLRIEKILAVGSADFTLIGRPLLSRELLHVEATVIEKTYAIPRPVFRHIPRKRYRRLHWFRTPFALLRINGIKFLNTVGDLPQVEGLGYRILV